MTIQANILKVAAVAIAAPRYAGAFGAAIGVSAIERYTWLAGAEIATGAAMAILEGFALAFVLNKWRLLAPRSAHWYILLTFIGLLALTVPAVALPYLLIEQSQLSISALFAGWFALQASWSFLVAGVPMLVIMAVGFADVEETDRAKHAAKSSADVKRVKREVKQAAVPVVRNESEYQCEDCGFVSETQNGLNAHRRYCEATTERNGTAQGAK